MAKINAYPKFSRNMLIILSVVFAATFVFVAVHRGSPSPQTGFAYAATVVFAFLLLPVLSTVQYVIRLVDGESNRLKFSDDVSLLKLIEPLLAGVDYKLRVGQYPSDERNAFAIASIFSNKATIGFSSSLVAAASPAQLLAIAAHEVGHLKSGDSKNKAYILAFNHMLKTYPFLLAETAWHGLKVGAMLAGGLAIIGFVGVALLRDVTEAFRFLWSFLGPIIKVGAVPALCIIGFVGLNYGLDRLFFAYSREREFAADAMGAALTSSTAMISALGLLTDPKTAVGVFDTHPPLIDRRERLGALDPV